LSFITSLAAKLTFVNHLSNTHLISFFCFSVISMILMERTVLFLRLAGR